VEASLEELLGGLLWSAVLARAALAPPPARASLSSAPPPPAPEGHASPSEAARVIEQLAQPGSSAFHLALAARVEGGIDRDALDEALQIVAARHDALRTTFVVADDGVRRRVAPAPEGRSGPGSVAVERQSCSEAELATEIDERAYAPFDLANGPLLRAVVVDVTRGGVVVEHALVLAAHHLIMDLAALEIVLQELGIAYAAVLAGVSPALPSPGLVGAAAVAAQELTEAAAAHDGRGRPAEVARRWDARLAGPLPVLRLPRSGPRRRVALRPAGLARFTLDPALARGVEALARETGTTVFTVLLAAFHALLSHWSSQDESVIGCEASGRGRGGRDRARVVGSLVRPLPVRARLDRSASFAAHVGALRAPVLDALDDQDQPFVVTAARLSRGGALLGEDAPPMFQAVFDYYRDRETPGLAAVALGLPGVPIALGPLSLRTLALAPRHAHSEIALLVAAVAAPGGPSLEGALLHDASLHDPEMVARMAGDLQVLLRACLADAKRPLATLLASLPPRRLAVHVAASFVADGVEAHLADWLERAGLPADVVLGGYDPILASLHDPASALRRHRGPVVVLARVESLARGLSGASRDAALETNVEAWIDGFRAWGASSPPEVVLAVAPLDPGGPGAAGTSSADESAAGRARARLLALAELPWLEVIDLAHAAEVHGATELLDREARDLGDAPFGEEMLAVAGVAAARALRRSRVTPRKLIVVDADETLWGGVVGEDGPERVRTGEPWARLHRQLLARRDAGFLVALVSKNAESDVRAAFAAHPSMSLRPEHFVALRAGWDPKPAVVSELARGLGFGLDAVVFVDDSQVECEAMRAACPEVLVVRAPVDLDSVWDLDVGRITAEDRRRADLYQEEAARTRARATAGSLAAFLDGLGVVVEITPLGEADAPRAAQLTQRTNQLNTTTRRMTVDEVLAERDAWVVRVRDRFGDYGLVGFLVLALDEGRGARPALRVGALMLSCRVLGRGVEARLVEWLAVRAEERGLGEIALPYARTARNEPALRMLAAVAGDDTAVLRAEGEVRLGVRDAKAAAARLRERGAGPVSERAEAPAETAPAPLVPDARAPIGASQRLVEATTSLRTASAIVAESRRARGVRRLASAASPARALDGREQAIATIWEHVLGVLGIPVEGDFFALGGTSLQALAMVARVRREQGVDVDVAAVFTSPRLEDFARVVAASPSASPPPRESPSRPLLRGRRAPASSLQRRLWVLHRIDPADPAYHVPFAARLRGTLAPDEVRAALATVIERHDALRVRFEERDGEPWIAVGDPSSAATPLETVDLGEAGEQTAELTAWLASFTARPFDLASGPLLRAGLARLGPEDHALVVVAHHAAVDGASLEVLVAELASLLLDAAASAALPRAGSFLRVAQAMADAGPPDPARVAAAIARLGGVPRLELPFEPLASAASAAPGAGERRGSVPPRGRAGAPRKRGRVVARVLPRALTAALVDRAREASATRFVAIVAAFGWLLGRLAAREEVILGVPVSRRRDEASRVVGPLVDTAVVRLATDPVDAARPGGGADTSPQPADRLLARARDAMTAAHRDADVPFLAIAPALGDGDPGSARLGVLIVEQPSIAALARRAGGEPPGARRPPAARGLEISAIPVHAGGAQADLLLAVSDEPGGGLRLALEHREDLLTAGDADRLLERLEVVLEALAGGAPDLRAVPLTLGDEQRELLALGAGPSRPYAVGESLVDAIVRQAGTTPDAVAVEDEAGLLSYRTLLEQARNVARALVARGVERGDRVGIAMARSRGLMPAILGVLLAGAAYLPLERELPMDRRRWMADHAATRLVIVDEDERLPWAARAVTLDGLLAEVEGTRALELPPVRGADLAYVIYTSGSTGTPKGVMVEHGGVVNRLEWQEEVLGLGGGRDEAVLQKTPTGFDVSVWELFWPLRVGARLVMARPGGHKDPSYLVSVIAERGITTLHFVPSMLGAFVAWEGLERLSMLRRVVTSGEALTPAHVEALRRRMPWVEIHNLYGPTEATVDVTHWPVPRDVTTVADVPIGRPIANTRAYVVDDRGALAPRGVAGELWLAGVQLARGYLGNPAETAARFVADPFGSPDVGAPARAYRTGDRARWRRDGSLAYLGRLDDQVKIRGHRIELGEIEARLREHPGVADVACVVRTTDGDARLVAFVVARGSVEPGALREHLLARLPGAMVPAAFARVAALPLGPSGKVRRADLPALESWDDAGSAEVAPVSPWTSALADARISRTERVLVGIWRDVLRRPAITVGDDFFAVGGDSILALKVVSRARAEGLPLLPRDVFEEPRLADLARRADRLPSLEVVALGLEAGDDREPAPLLPMQAWLLARQPSPLRDQHLQSVRLRIETAAPPRERAARLRAALEGCVRRHPALRLRLVLEAGDLIAATQSAVSEIALGFEEEALGPGAPATDILDRAHERAAAAVGLQAPKPQLAAVWLGRDDGTGELVLAAHHASIDAVSWRVLVDDLLPALRAPRTAGAGEGERDELDVAAASLSPLAWARGLAAWARSPDAEADAATWSRWLAPLPPEAFRVPLEGAAATEDAARRHVVRLSSAVTASVLASARALSCEIDEVLLATLAHTLRGGGGDALVVDAERHGREAPFLPGVDTTRTVGWLTALFPLVLGGLRSRSIRAAVERAREAMARVPAGGLAFEALMRAAGREPLPPRDVLFNFLGTLGEEREGVRVVSTSHPSDRAGGSPRSHRLEILAHLEDGELAITWIHAPAGDDAARVDAWATAHVEALRAFASETLGVVTARFPEREDLHALSWVQEGMLVEAAREARGAVYVEQLAVPIEGVLDVARLEEAWVSLVRRHPALRTAYVAGLAVVLAPEVALARGVFQRGRAPRSSVELEEWLDDDRDAGFDPAEAPLLRVTLLEEPDPARATLVLTHHHLAIDGWCLPILLRELTLLYGGADLGAPPRPYRDFVRWLLRRDGSTARAHFRERLQALERPTPLPRDRGHGGAASRQSLGERQRVTRRFAPDLASRLRMAAERAQVTPSTLLLAAYALLLARTTGGARVAFGVAVHGRPSDLDGAESMVGVLMRTLPFAAEIEEWRPVFEWLRDLQRALVADQTHGHLRMVDIHAESPLPMGSALFETLFAVENYPLELAAPGTALTFGRPRVAREVAYPLAFVVPPGDALAVEVDFDDMRLLARDVEDLVDRYATLLEQLADATADVAVEALGVLLPGERELLLAAAASPGVAALAGPGSDPARPDPASRDVATMHALVAHAMLATPQALAISDGATRLTYGELAGAAAALSSSLRAADVKPGERVGVMIEASSEYVVGLLGVLGAGAVFVPLDPSYPEVRLAWMVEASGASVIVVTSRSAPLARTVAPGARAVLVDPFARGVAVPIPRTADDHAYVLFTSGSTGQPKPVLVPHRGVVALIGDVDARAPLPRDAAGALWTSPSFDVSVWEIFATLSRGATLHVVPAAVRADASALAVWLSENDVASAYVPGFALEALSSALASGWCRSLRRILVGVEPIASELLQKLMWNAPALAVINGYGPTEASICATLHTVSRGEVLAPIVPIGRAVRGARVYLLDGRLEPVPTGVPGEIHVGGVGLAHGYLGHPQLTAERFVPDPFVPLGGLMYRTGDRAVALEDGSLVFLGRSDHQVKIRGVRVELAEVDAALARRPEVREASALAVEAPAGQILVALIAPRDASTFDPAALRSDLRRELPDAMVPGRIVVVTALPRDPNGKVDRRELAAMAAEAPESAGRDRPATETEQVLAAIWRQLLGAPLVARTDDFFALGGSSLSATQLVSRVREEVGVELLLRAIFEAPTLGELAAVVDRIGRDQGLQPIPRLDATRAAPSFAQERLVFIDRLDPGNPVYNLACAARLRGAVDEGALRRALAELLRRHEALRTVFVQEDDRLFQVIRSLEEVLERDAEGRWVAPLVVEDVSAETRPLEAALARAAASAQRSFDLARGPLLRAHLRRLAADDHVISLTLHHVVADGWSLGIVLRELGELYEAAAEVRSVPRPGSSRHAVAMKEPEIQYADFAAWQREVLDPVHTADLLAYWRSRLAGAPPLLELPVDRARPAVQSFRGGHVRFHLDRALLARVEAQARRASATPAMVLLAALHALLMRWSGARDVSVGVSLANRRRRETEALIGFFVNVVVVRVEEEERPTFEALLRQVRQRSLEAYDHQDLPFDRVVDDLRPRRTLAHAPLFQVNFVHQEEVSVPPWLTPLVVETGTARFDLALAISQGDGGLSCALEYNGDVFDRATAEQFADGYARMVAGVLDRPAAPIEAVPLVDDAQRAALLAIAAGPGAQRFPDLSLFPEAVARVARRSPDLVALRRHGPAAEEITYAELDARANRLAHLLRAYGTGRGVIVGVALPRSVSAVVTILAIARAGGAYVPLDPLLPLDRLAAILDDARPALVVTSDAVADAVPAAAAHVLVLDELEELLAAQPETALDGATALKPSDLAYVIYTSGSTGVPNGVAIEHGALANLAFAQSIAFGIEEGSRVLQFASLAFDASVSEIATTLCRGATLDLGSGPDRDDVAEALAHVTVATLPPSLLAVLEPAAYPELRTVISAGEALTGEIARRWAGAKVRIINAYGPTEATVCATLGVVEPDGRAPSIGRPMANVRVHVLDAERRPVPPGVVGELAIGGAGVARGYLGRPELTALRFVPDPFSAPARDGASPPRLFLTGDLGRLRADGTIEFLGRSDGQVKVRGHRVECAEIEARLRSHPAVRDVAVVLQRDRSTRDGEVGAARLVAWIVAEPDGAADPELAQHAPPVDAPLPPLDEASLQAHVARALPAYMVPERFLPVIALPRNTSGKVDRRALSALVVGDAAHPVREIVGPRDAIEEVLELAVREVLRLGELSVHDNFFELGGDSIASIQIAARARREGVAFSVKDMFLHQTVAELARVASRVTRSRTNDEPAVGDVPLTPIQRWFFEQRSPDPAHYVQSVMVEVDDAVRLEPPLCQAAIAALVAQHDALRLRFLVAEATPLDPSALAPAPPPWSLVRQTHAEGEEAAASVAFAQVALGPLEEAPLEVAVRAACEAAREGLDLARGPIARVTVLDLGPSRPRQVFFVVHHLVIDTVSLRVLVEDFFLAHAAASAGRAPSLGPKTASYQAWSRDAWSRTGDMTEERRTLAALHERRVRLPSGDTRDERGAGTRGDAAELRLELDVETTTALAGSVLAALSADMPQLLLTALGLALGPDLGGGVLVVDVERHGREALDQEDPLDVSRTVGWFTAIVPVRLDTAESGSARQMLRAVKEASFPTRGGVGFGFVGYEGSGDVGLNYLGRVDRALGAGAPVRLAELREGATGDDQGPRTPRPHALEIQAMIRDGRLRLVFTYAPERHPRATIERWGGAMEAALRELAASASAPAPVYAAVDFPEAELSPAELDDLLAEMRDGGGS